jgi:outer membrane protein TolC
MNPPCCRLAALCICVLAGCAPQPYSPRDLELDSAVEYAGRSAQAPALAQFVAQSGYERTWPPEQWGLTELTLLALYFSPEIRVARAHAAVARSEVAAASSAAPFGLTPVVEHHSREVEGDGPWSVGVALEFPWIARSKREARLERAVALSDAADLEVARTIWHARAQARDRHIDLIDSRERLGVLEAGLSARHDMRALVARRVDAGMLSARDLSQEDALVAELQSALAAERGRLREAQVALARAVGLPLETFDALAIASHASFVPVEPMARDALRESALRNRLDVYQGLLAFAAADAEVKLAVASQYPELALSPGFLWDQGDAVWSLAGSIAFSPELRAKAAIRQAEAKRELAAQRFLELQTQVIGEAERAAERLLSARSLSEAAARQSEAARAQLLRVERLFEGGGADRLQLTAARLAASSAADGERLARTSTLRALAGLEDVLQEPVLDSDEGARTLAGEGAIR